jgi:hypothetical protein
MHDGSRTRTKLAKSCKILQDPLGVGFHPQHCVQDDDQPRARKPGVA